MVHRNPLMPLSAVPTGRSVILWGVQAGRRLTARLAAMGFVPGVAVDVLRNDGAGPVVVVLKGMRVMLGRGMANKMSVE